MNDREIYYVLYPYRKEDISQSTIDYDKLLGYVFVKLHKSTISETVYLRSIYPHSKTLLTVDEKFLSRSGLQMAMSKEIGCVLQDISDEGTDTIPKCKWYGEDGCCFLNGAGCSPQYRQFSALRKWGVPLDNDK